MDSQIQKIYVGDIGTDIIVDCGSDISTATVHELKVKKPDRTIVTWSADILNTKFIKHITVSGDLNQSGTYTIQSHIVIPSVGEWLGESASFVVYTPFS